MDSTYAHCIITYGSVRLKIKYHFISWMKILWQLHNIMHVIIQAWETMCSRQMWCNEHVSWSRFLNQKSESTGGISYLFSYMQCNVISCHMYLHFRTWLPPVDQRLLIKFFNSIFLYYWQLISSYIGTIWMQYLLNLAHLYEEI